MSNIKLYTAHDGQPVTTSRNIAEMFNKQHKHVLDAIRRITNQMSNEIRQPNFRLTHEPDSQGKLRTTYEITERGFLLLAMGFGGKKALQFKLAYITEFERLTQTAHDQSQIIIKLQQDFLINNPKHNAVLELRRAGYPTKYIAEMLDVAKSTINKRTKELANIGLWQKSEQPLALAQYNLGV